MPEPDVRAWYCKSKKSTGRPVEVQRKCDARTQSSCPVEDTSSFSRQGCMKVSMKYGNAHPRAKKSGATTVLEVYDLPPGACR